MLLTLIASGLSLFGMHKFRLQLRNHSTIINISILAIATMETMITLWQPDFFYGMPYTIWQRIYILGQMLAYWTAFPFSVKITFSAPFLELGNYELLIHLANLPIISLQSPTIPLLGPERVLWMLSIRLLAFPIVFLLNLTIFPIFLFIQHSIHRLQSTEFSQMPYHHNNSQKKKQSRLHQLDTIHQR